MMNRKNGAVWAIIPARGGSKGIPGKNLAPVAGKPLLAWTIEAARKATTIDRVLVSTDDPSIAATAQEHGAEVVSRPADISGDLASSEAALLHALQSYATETGSDLPEITVFLQCTSPLTSDEDIDGTVQALQEQQADSALAACPFHYFIWREGPDGEALEINHDKSVRQMRQQREPEYIEAGSVYAMRTQGFLEARHRFFGKTVIHETPAERRWEIDDPVDLEIADVLMKAHGPRHPLERTLRELRAVVFDFDGVMTNNRVTVAQSGEESVVCDRSDGMGVELLKRQGLSLYVLSREDNPVVAARCKKLDLECSHSVRHKLPELEQWAKQHGHTMSQLAFVGNDINDVECMNHVGLPVAVGDAYPAAKAAAKLVLCRPGGQGAVRELADLIISHQEE